MAWRLAHDEGGQRAGPLAVACVLLLATGAACSRRAPESVMDAALRARSTHPPAEAVACAACHPAVFEEWAASQHARANRLVSDAEDRAAFEPSRRVEHGSFVTVMKAGGADRLLFAASFSNSAPETFRAEAVIGITPLRQYLVASPGGRLQVMDVGYDPRSNEWFNVFGDENRQPHEWGHWKGRSMTWNAQCAFCHMTGFEKNYNSLSDAYASTWKAMGISCVQCHEVIRPITRDQCAVTGKVQVASAARRMDNCASCHARREELFGTFKPGDRFDDHFRLILPDQPGVFHADGQVREEDFEYASFLMSRMGHKGVSCMDCHNPHSGKLKLPVENNTLCLQCHTPPGANGATPIIPKEHMFHAEGRPGGRCVDCHMSEHVYMARDWRRDHGFTSPDPRLTIEHGVPNACNRCHADQTPQWAEEWAMKWYGDKMETRRARHRARAVAAYHEGLPAAMTNVLHMARTEEIDAWRAALVAMLAEWRHEPDIRAFLEAELQHPHPRVRSSAVLALGGAPGTEALLDALRADPSALVRVDAALATARAGRAPHAEVLAYLRNISDQPAGAMRNAQVALMEGRTAEVKPWTDKMTAWDASPGSFFMAGRMQHDAGLVTPARSNLAAAALGARGNADYSYTLALALGEARNAPLALQWLEETVRRAPDFGRAWYNLGLAYAGAERLPDAVAALQRAESLLPTSPDPAFARATVHLRMQDPGKARAAALVALQRDPRHAQAQALLRRLGPGTPPGG